MGYLDEAGFSLTLPPGYTWGPRGKALGVPRVWGSRGRLNVLAHLVWDGAGWRLHFALVRGPVRMGEVVAYLGRVAEGLGRPLKLFLDNAAFHRGREVREREGEWRARGLHLGYLPRYSPHLNPVETVWRRVKGSLMPRRHYPDLDALEEAVRSALQALGGVEVKI